MKKIYLFLMMACMGAAFTACSSDEDTTRAMPILTSLSQLLMTIASWLTTDVISIRTQEPISCLTIGVCLT